MAAGVCGMESETHVDALWDESLLMWRDEDNSQKYGIECIDHCIQTPF